MEIEIERVSRKVFLPGRIKLGTYARKKLSDELVEKIFRWSLEYDIDVVRKFLDVDETYIVDLRSLVLGAKKIRNDFMYDLIDIFSADEILVPEEVMDCDENIIFEVCEIWSIDIPVIGTYINNANIRYVYEYFDWPKILFYVNFEVMIRSPEFSDEAIIWIFGCGIKNGMWKNRWNRILSDVISHRKNLLPAFVGEYVRLKNSRVILTRSV